MKKNFLQIGLLTGIPLPTDGRPALNRDAGIQLFLSQARLQAGHSPQFPAL